MNVSRMVLVGILSGAFLLTSLSAGTSQKQKTLWTFEEEETGATPKGFVSAVGHWRIVEYSGGKVLAQIARNPENVFNIILVDGIQAQDLNLTVQLRPIGGKNDQGGGLVWRAKDAKNYYLARFNPLEKNFRVYTVVDGKRTQLQGADVDHAGDWRLLRVNMTGDHIVCYLDGAKLLEVHDTTFPDSGKIGLWSKSDAQTEFDNLNLHF
jgi:hypothetical protein